MFSGNPYSIPPKNNVPIIRRGGVKESTIFNLSPPIFLTYFNKTLACQSASILSWYSAAISATSAFAKIN